MRQVLRGHPAFGDDAHLCTANCRLSQMGLCFSCARYLLPVQWYIGNADASNLEHVTSCCWSHCCRTEWQSPNPLLSAHACAPRRARGPAPPAAARAPAAGTRAGRHLPGTPGRPRRRRRAAAGPPAAVCRSVAAPVKSDTRPLRLADRPAGGHHAHLRQSVVINICAFD